MGEEVGLLLLGLKVEEATGRGMKLPPEAGNDKGWILLCSLQKEHSLAKNLILVSWDLCQTSNL